MQEVVPQEACLIANAIPHVGPITWGRIIEYYGFESQPEAVFKLTEKQLRAVQGVGEVVARSIMNWSMHFDIAQEKKRMRDKEVRFWAKSDAEYPFYLKQIEDAPIGLYAKGELQLNQRTIAIVGSRRATLYGMTVAKKLAKELARMGFCIVSGLARGVDTAAHEGALDAKGATVAVLGCGVDIVYPPENEKLYDQIVERGLVLSEFTLGRIADKQTFPMRNRIISGMAQAVIVVETDLKGGSMITARLAGEQGRQVFAVPGRIDQTTSRGCNHLIREGATLLTSVDDILTELQYMNQLELGFADTQEAEEGNAQESAILNALTNNEQKLFQALREGGKAGIADLIHRTQLSVVTVLPILTKLEIKRLITKHLDGTYEAVCLIYSKKHYN